MEVEIISREAIRPSSPTPPHLQTYKISFIDQLLPAAHIPFVIFYAKSKETNLNISDTLKILKTSLSETITHYYPLAGTVKDGLTIDCNDKGALFSTAHVKYSIAELLREPKIELFQKLWMFPQTDENGFFLLSFQFNMFSCGGVAMCMSFYHKVIDATTMSSFLSCWAAIANGSQGSGILVEFKSESLFPGKESLPENFTLQGERSMLRLREGKGIVRRFVFKAEAVSALKAGMINENLYRTTGFQVVTSFIWKHTMAAAKSVRGVQQPSALTYTVDSRRRMVPPLENYSAGNIFWKIIARREAKGTDDEQIKLDDLVESVTMGMKKFKNEFVAELQTDKWYKAMCKFLEELREIGSEENLNVYEYSSWCKLGFNQVDFGWGKPIWVSLVWATEVLSILRNYVALSDGAADGEIDAWLILDEDEMAVLEKDQEFLAFASRNPGINYCQ